MKKFSVILLAAVAATLFLCGAAQITYDAGGIHVGDAASDLVGFYGSTPVVQPTSSSQAVVGSQTGYVTVASLKPCFFTGSNGAGNVTVSGLASGDTIKLVVNLTDTADATAGFDVTGTNLIHQSSASDYSTKKFIAIIGVNSTTDIAALKTLSNAERSALVNLGLMKGS